MARKVAKGTSQLATQLDSELLAAVRGFAQSRNETLREVLELALRRHLANPPPVILPPPIPPLPPLAPPVPPAPGVLPGDPVTFGSWTFRDGSAYHKDQRVPLLGPRLKLLQLLAGASGPVPLADVEDMLRGAYALAPRADQTIVGLAKQLRKHFGTEQPIRGSDERGYEMAKELR